MQYSVAHTQVEAVFESAQSYGYAMYKRRLNSWVYIWVIDLPEDHVSTTYFLLRYGSWMTRIND